MKDNTTPNENGGNTTPKEKIKILPEIAQGIIRVIWPHMHEYMSDDHTLGKEHAKELSSRIIDTASKFTKEVAPESSMMDPILLGATLRGVVEAIAKTADDEIFHKIGFQSMKTRARMVGAIMAGMTPEEIAYLFQHCPEIKRHMANPITVEDFKFTGETDELPRGIQLQIMEMPCKCEQCESNRKKTEEAAPSGQPAQAQGEATQPQLPTPPPADKPPVMKVPKLWNPHQNN